MKATTPAINIRQQDLENNTEALRLLLQNIPKKIRAVIDVRYGLGGWAREVVRFFPGCTLQGYEIDDETRKAAWKLKKFKIYDEPLQGRHRTELLLADFNSLTILKRGELDKLLRRVETDYLIFTDIACSKLHLNHGSYGLPEGAIMEEYWEGFEIEGYQLLDFSRTHHFASSALYEKIPQT